ncbi:UNKNOWN [Stylonychia lemnae]|uniref:Dickkopf N-terminal cysteine-rich domain-containing protein n=1 Tax=Stylonychia lemnae TaxID=5949 RepID=A0A078ABI7_STYLE|nr:UNKNOWN [Stylonychia lemnae]|eukprot:CDW78942.1 UNKNOWN [Stylonychia lemnae]
MVESAKSCPQIQCDDYLGQDVCFLHSASNPVTFVRFTQCEDQNKVCYMGENYAWLDAQKQFYNSGTKIQNSQIYMKNTQGRCMNVNDFRNELLPGRNCSYDTQCLSGTCNSAGVCSGKAINEPCAENSECEINLACIPSKTFPWQTICRKYLYEGDSCENDYQCGINMICTPPNSTASFNDANVCMKKYDLVDGSVTGYKIYKSDVYSDSLRNGLKCRSGICRMRTATECQCFSIVNVTTDYGLQSDSTFYKCTAMSQYNHCQYYYVHDEDNDGVQNLGYLRMNCQCSMDGSVGYCPMPGQSKLIEYISIMKILDTYAVSCHSLDRYNLEAQMECGIGKQYSNIENLRDELEIIFRFEYWPYAQYQSQRSIIHPCLNKGHSESPINIIRQTNILRKLYSSSSNIQ